MKTMRQRGFMFRIVVLVMVLSLFPLSFPASADTVIENSPAGLEERDERAVRAITRYESEYNNSMPTADLIEDDDTTYGKIAFSGDEDFYKIMFASEGTANFWVGDIPSGKDYDLYLYDSNGVVIASSTSNNSANTQEFIGSYHVLAHTVYYVKVFGYNSYDAAAYYQLRVKKLIRNETETNNTMATADEIYNGETMQGKIGTNGDVDYYKICFPYKGEANFWLGNIPTGKDYDLYLHDAAGKILFSSVGPNTGSPQEFIDHYPVVANHWYYVRIVGYGCFDASTDYKLSVKCYTVKDVKIIYDYTCTYSESQMNSALEGATADFASDFAIDFTRYHTMYTSELTGSSCPYTSNSSYCNASCGNNDNCNDIHHKGASRLLNIQPSPLTMYTCRVVGHRMCFYNNNKNTHSGVLGLGDRLGRDSIVTHYSGDLEYLIQHEMTHNLGASHDECMPGQQCVLDGDMGIWCANCIYAIRTNR